MQLCPWHRVRCWGTELSRTESTPALAEHTDHSSGPQTSSGHQEKPGASWRKDIVTGSPGLNRGIPVWETSKTRGNLMQGSHIPDPVTPFLFVELTGVTEA